MVANSRVMMGGQLTGPHTLLLENVEYSVSIYRRVCVCESVHNLDKYRCVGTLCVECEYVCVRRATCRRGFKVSCRSCGGKDSRGPTAAGR